MHSNGEEVEDRKIFSTKKKAFEAYKDFLDKITLSTFDNLLLSKIFTNEKGQLVVVFN